MNIPKKRLALVLLLSTLAGASGLRAEDDAFAPDTVGCWIGNARIIVAWAKQTNLSVTLNIRPDGSVTGKVGDAVLTDGRLKKNRGALGRNLKVNTDYIVVGKLQGSIVAAESITRARVKIPLNLGDGVLSGGLHTSGCAFGGKEQMIFSAASLRLERTRDR